MKLLFRGVAFLVLAIIWVGCQEEAVYEKPPTPVEAYTVGPSRALGGKEVRFSANIVPKEQVVLAFKCSGYVKELAQVRDAQGRQNRIQAGDRIAQGEVLAQVHEADYRAKVDQAESQLSASQAVLKAAQSQTAEARAAFEHATVNFDRAKKLFETQSITKPEHDGAKVGFEAAQARLEAATQQLKASEAQVETAKAQLREAQLALQDCTLSAPWEALVLSRLVEVGALVGPGTPGFVLAEPSSVKAIFGVPDVTIQYVKLGDRLAITTEALAGREFQGRVSRISPSADPKSRLFEVEITLSNPIEELKLGMIASLQMPAGAPVGDFPAVPLSAIVQSKENPNNYAVVVVEETSSGETAGIREVELGEPVGNMITVTQGIRSGERVIVKGASLVVDGEMIRVIG